MLIQASSTYGTTFQWTLRVGQRLICSALSRTFELQHDGTRMGVGKGVVCLWLRREMSCSSCSPLQLQQHGTRQSEGALDRMRRRGYYRRVESREGRSSNSDGSIEIELRAGQGKRLQHQIDRPRGSPRLQAINKYVF